MLRHFNSILTACGVLLVSACGGRATSCYVEQCPELAADAPGVFEEPTAEGGGRVCQGPSEPVRSQPEIEALRGCRTVEGDLALMSFEGVDLTPLSNLTEVTGDLSFGSTQSSGPGFLTLEGFEALRVVGGELELEGLLVESLDALSALQQVESLTVSDSARLSSLNALSGLFVTQSLSVRRNPQLTSIGLLVLAPSIGSVSLSDNPALTDWDAVALVRDAERVSLHGGEFSDVSPLQRLRSVAELTIERASLSDLEPLAGLRISRTLGLFDLPNLESLEPLQLEQLDDVFIRATGIVDLRGLAGARVVHNLSIVSNPRLTDASALRGLGSFQELQGAATLDLTLESNAALVELPDMPGLEQVESLAIVDNPMLTRGPSFPNLTRVAERLQIDGNPALQSVEGFPSLRSAGSIGISDNASLSGIRFDDLESADSIYIACNPALGEVSLNEEVALELTRVEPSDPSCQR